MIGGVVVNVRSDWVLLASKGDKDAFTEIYHSCYNDFYKFSLYTLGNAEDAADAVSDAFFEVWKGLPKLKNPDCFASWAFRILAVCCKKQISGIIQKRKTYDLDDLTETPSDSAAPLEESITEASALAHALSQLDAEERMVIVFSVLYGYTNKEIAEMLGKPQGTVSSKIHRTYAKLRSMLGGENRE